MAKNRKASARKLRHRDWRPPVMAIERAVLPGFWSPPGQGPAGPDHL